MVELVSASASVRAFCPGTAADSRHSRKAAPHAQGWPETESGR